MRYRRKETDCRVSFSKLDKRAMEYIAEFERNTDKDSDEAVDEKQVKTIPGDAHISASSKDISDNA